MNAVQMMPDLIFYRAPFHIAKAKYVAVNKGWGILIPQSSHYLIVIELIMVAT